MTIMRFMRTVNVAELKANLSKYLRAVQLGERVVVVSRQHPVAELVPTRRKALSTWERLASEGRCKLPRRRLREVAISRMKQQVRWLEALRWVQGEP